MPKTYININGDVRDASSFSQKPNRDFRDAWQFDGDAIDVDLEKAKKIKSEELRRERDEMFGGLDAQYMKALEREDDVKKKEVADKKQKLRDMTENKKLTKAKSVDELAKLKIDDLI